jgi:ATP-dependent Clp protease ATP-binding subunit ClpA
MDHGTLTDNNGRKADFRNVILIMTSNAGAQEINRRSMGFLEQDNSTDGMEMIRKQFTPEFRNRLDAIVQFRSLPMNVVTNIADKFLTELQAQLDDKRVMMEVDDDVRDWLAEKGYDEHMGARPMSRLIQDKVKRPLADMILFGPLSRGGTVHLSIRNDELALEAEEEAETV